MNPAELAQQLLASDGKRQEHLLRECLSLLSFSQQLSLARYLKEESGRLLRADIADCLATADLILRVAAISENGLARALGLLAKANARAIGLGEYHEAIVLYEEAASIYEREGYPIEQATAQIGKLWPLSQLGRYQEAFKAGHWASDILEQHEAWRPLARINTNLAIIHFRLGQDEQALELFERAQEIYERLGGREEPGWLRAEQNRAIVLRNLGRFEASIDASKRAWRRLEENGQPIEAARARQNLAITYFVLGRYNEALELLDAVKAIFLEDGRRRDALLADLFISDCLLQLRRFRDVLEKCSQVRELFRELGADFEVAQAILNEAIAYAGLDQPEQAMHSLAEARTLFQQIGNPTWVATTDLETATNLLQQEAYAEALSLAEECAAVFARQAVPMARAQADLIAARAALALGAEQVARRRLRRTVAFAEKNDIPTLRYRSHYLSGELLRQDGERGRALAEFDRAILQLERLQGRLMVEFRADFLQDKEAVYRDAVSQALDLHQPAAGLEYAERAKSRALLDLIAYRLELGVRARSPGDRELVEELSVLRAERDRHYRRWASGEGGGTRGAMPTLEEQQQAQQEVLSLEKRITELWHRLLVRNADYAREAALWQVRTEPVQPYLDEGTLLLEYFVARDELVIFLVTADTIDVIRLPDPMPQVQQLLQLLWLNLKAVARTPNRAPMLTANARGLLERLHQLLLGPLAGRLAEFSRLILVPHGSLHYLPFHALHDGKRFLLETHEISYLPAASFLRYCRHTRPNVSGLLAVGHSLQGRLPHAIREAEAIASSWRGELLKEESATRDRVRARAADCRVLHLATHGDFRPDNPLFSGLVLGDGWLTTLDIFNLRLQASLVVLSACQTGRNVVGGGDELLGLLRAFLSAGAASLALSLWAVEDRSTSQLMTTFYEKLADGESKGNALRQAQLALLRGVGLNHPYYWAPFFLVGDAGAL